MMKIKSFFIFFILIFLSAGDIAALISNPKFMSLLNNHKIQEIQKKLAQ